MTTLSSKWQTAEVSKTFLEDVRGAIPGAQLQFEVIAKIVERWFRKPKFIIDLGCGNGILGTFLLTKLLSAHGFFVDFPSRCSRLPPIAVCYRGKQSSEAISRPRNGLIACQSINP